MKQHAWSILKSGSQQGVSAVLVVILLTVFLGLAALAIDIGYLYVVKNELQNAADAGALAGARNLYIGNGTAINTGANADGHDAAEANLSAKTPVEVNWTEGNTGDVQRGHWCFRDKKFTPNASAAVVHLWDTSTEELDLNEDFINAVRVKARRESTPAASFFARIFGFQDFSVSAEAVAYIGFAGTLEPEEADQPIAICKESLLDSDGKYTCGVGRMINSGSNEGHQTGGWTNFTQPCETASANSVRPLVCSSGNPNTILLGQGMGTTGGEVQSAFNDLYSCWKSAGLDTDGNKWPDKVWTLTLPVIECPGNNTGNCSKVVGAVTIDIVWITKQDKETFKEVPRKMEDWTCPEGYTGEQCWSSFVAHFQLKDVLNNTDAIYENVTMYFKPSCVPHIPAGRSGGENFGILARIPALVK